VPVNGRNFEYVSGEDPYLGYSLVQPLIQGIQSQGIIANIKHYIDNNQEYNRLCVSANIDDRTEHEIYQIPFVGGVQAGVLSVMCAYNRINDVYACEDERMLNLDLKTMMGFGGFVMSDWGATHSTVLSATRAWTSRCLMTATSVLPCWPLSRTAPCRCRPSTTRCCASC